MWTKTSRSSSGVIEMATLPAPTDWPWPRNQMALATDTAENHPTELSGAATQPMRAGSTTTDHVPTAASAPARRAAGIAVEGLVDEVTDAVVDVVVVLDGASGLTPALRVLRARTGSPPWSQDPRHGASAHDDGAREGPDVRHGSAHGQRSPAP